MPTLRSAITARLEADTSLMALLPANARILHNANFDDSSVPSVTFNLLEPTSNDAFRMSSDELLLDVHVFVEKRAGASTVELIPGTADADTHVYSILDRITGDWTAQTYPTGPTYGLDRWRADLSASGWNATAMAVVGRARPVDIEGDILHYTAEFKVWVSKVAV